MVRRYLPDTLPVNGGTWRLAGSVPVQVLNWSLMSPGNVTHGSAEDGGNALPLGRCRRPTAQQDCRHSAFIETAAFDQLRQGELVLSAQFFDGGGHDRGCFSRGQLASAGISLPRNSEVLFESETSIANVSRVHRVPPTDLVDLNSEGVGDALTLGGAGGPAAEGNRLYPRHGQSRSLGDVFDCERRLFEQQVDRFHDRSHNGKFCRKQTGGFERNRDNDLCHHTETFAGINLDRCQLTANRHNSRVRLLRRPIHKRAW